ncbi:hypothetical protein K439DRAFT_1535481 [Ramaria rubella]|nr:hypothetical protein K439DRAFT_1535481 [Ramaria rubella]
MLTEAGRWRGRGRHLPRWEAPGGENWRINETRNCQCGHWGMCADMMRTKTAGTNKLKGNVKHHNHSDEVSGAGSLYGDTVKTGCVGGARTQTKQAMNLYFMCSTKCMAASCPGHMCSALTQTGTESIKVGSNPKAPGLKYAEGVKIKDKPAWSIQEDEKMNISLWNVFELKSILRNVAGQPQNKPGKDGCQSMMPQHPINEELVLFSRQ